MAEAQPAGYRGPTDRHQLITRWVPEDSPGRLFIQRGRLNIPNGTAALGDQVDTRSSPRADAPSKSYETSGNAS